MIIFLSGNERWSSRVFNDNIVNAGIYVTDANESVNTALDIGKGSGESTLSLAASVVDEQRERASPALRPRSSNGERDGNLPRAPKASTYDRRLSSSRPRAIQHRSARRLESCRLIEQRSRHIGRMIGLKPHPSLLSQSLVFRRNAASLPHRSPTPKKHSASSGP